ncbi:MAG: glycosyltransferase, partial [Clostridia bacterium]|nr:glycosyltransferase [Clostridia bacterium]
MKEKVSIIIPIYKVEEFLDNCVESVINQTYKNLEIILVDDGSPDNCPKKCDEWAKKDNRIKVIHKENGGVSSARNMALDIMSGDYVCFVDADDALNPQYVEILLKTSKQNDADVAICSWQKTKDLNFVNKPKTYQNYQIKTFHNEDV